MFDVYLVYMGYFSDIYYVRYGSLIFKIWFFFGVMDVVNLTSWHSVKHGSLYLFKDVNNKHLVVSATFLLNEVRIFNMKIPI